MKRAWRCSVPVSYTHLHLDEVHQLGAVVGTKVVDCLTSLEEGPFALRQSGGLPFDGVLELCSQHQGREEVLDALNQNGGLHGYLGLERLEDLFDLQGEQADLVRQALVYQIAKEIGALAAVLEGKVDAVSYTHLDVYKRQTQDGHRLFPTVSGL